MLDKKLCSALLCAAALAPLTAGSRVPDAPDYATPQGNPLGAVIAAQGNQALRDIREEARVSMREQKPASLAQMLVQVRHEAEPEKVVLEI